VLVILAPFSVSYANVALRYNIPLLQLNPLLRWFISYHSFALTLIRLHLLFALFTWGCCLYVIWPMDIPSCKIILLYI